MVAPLLNYLKGIRPTLCPNQQDSQKGLQAAVREGQGVSPPWLPAWLPGGVSFPNFSIEGLCPRKFKPSNQHSRCRQATSRRVCLVSFKRRPLPSTKMAAWTC